MNEVVRFSENLPRLSFEEQTARDAGEFINRYLTQWGRTPPNVSHHQHQLAVTEAILPEAEKHLARIKKLSSPASKVQIATQTALLLKSFPNAGKDNAEIFGRTLCQDVGSQAPTTGGLEAACRKLRRTCNFIPTIAEVLAALAEAEASQAKTIGMLAGLPEHRKRLAARVADDIEREAEWDRVVRKAEEEKLGRQREAEINAGLVDPDDLFE
jgi:hypothetical protein